MEIIVSLKNFNLLENKEIDGFVIGCIYSFFADKVYSFDEIKEIIKLNNHQKKLFILLNLVMHQNQIEEIKSFLRLFQKEDVFFIVQDLGIINLAKKLGMINKCIYHSYTMITNYQDLLSYQDGEEAIGLSNEIPLDDILQCSKASNNVFYTIFGYVPMYQTYRQIVSLYKEHKNLHFTNDHLYLQEATRLDSYCPILENEYGSVIFRDGTISILEQYEKVQLCKYVYLEGIFISNDVFDQVIDIYIKVFRGKLDVNEGLMMMKQLPLTYNNVFMNQDSKYDPKEFE